ncbi:MAG TPA: hypothetical protein PLZ43_04895 [bacterium]|nr:hypothetical protein [bacterium]
MERRLLELGNKYSLPIYRKIPDAQLIELKNTFPLIPSDFLTYLKVLGWISYEHIETFGLGAEVPRFLNVIQVALSEQNYNNIFKEAIPLFNNGAGDIVFISNDNSINILLHENNKIEKAIYKNIVDLLEHLLSF